MGEKGKFDPIKWTWGNTKRILSPNCNKLEPQTCGNNDKDL